MLKDQHNHTNRAPTSGEEQLMKDISQEVQNASVRAYMPPDVRFVWLPDIEYPHYDMESNMSGPLTPVPTPQVGNGPFHFFWDPVSREVIEDDLQYRQKGTVKTETQAHREEDWHSIPDRYFAYMRGLINGIISDTVGEAEPTPSAATSALQMDDGNLTSGPAPASRFVQVTTGGNVINLRKRYDGDGEGDEDPIDKADSPEEGATGGATEGSRGGGRVYTGPHGRYRGRGESDMGIVGWASGSQVDQTFSLRTLGFIFFLVIMYYCIICLGLILTYKTAILHPEVKFFSALDPQHDICRAESTASILQAFNQKPRAYIRVKGKGLDYQLDLSSWLTEGPIEDHRPIEAFVRSTNPFRSLTIVQQVACPVARELEKRVQGRLEQVGAPSSVEVSIPLKHVVHVYRNDQLANFLHNRTTRLLLALSGVGLLFFPYSWFCAATDVVTAHWRLNIDVDRFWAHVGPRIHRGGFRH